MNGQIWPFTARRGDTGADHQNGEVPVAMAAGFLGTAADPGGGN
ncbi:vegetative cell wall protein gp1-like [Iris pallida]|uniref:Vegetative cell wall protein gp1-like n=1 Tax=Iris pallida TaxID=29817 RepID=A0AAX6DUK2_IRIPA|nr:vegetative cell wall protein gp1-like [Iris pallida]